jgi:2-oxo-4-hydroxy-4-carboxy--5-ureidoimidazoline (OHCU) decarboxylase
VAAEIASGASSLPTVEELDQMSAPKFVEAVAPLFEGAPRFLARLAAARPFVSAEALFRRARSIAVAMPLDEQMELIDAHPRLGAPPSSVSARSFVEQGYDRDADAAGHAVDEAERERVAAELDRLNAAYEARFGFRFCVFVAGRPRAALIPGMEAALGAEREDEVRRALDAIVDIAADRWATASVGRTDRP